jgi:hypothetical protein
VAVCAGDHPPVLVDVAAEADEKAVVRDEARWHEQRVPADGTAVAHFDSAQVVVLDQDSLHGALDDPDRPGHQLRPLSLGQGCGWREGLDQESEPVGTSPRSVSTIRAAWLTHAPVGWAVIPALVAQHRDLCIFPVGTGHGAELATFRRSSVTLLGEPYSASSCSDDRRKFAV